MTQSILVGIIIGAISGGFAMWAFLEGKPHVAWAFALIAVLNGVRTL